MDKKIYAKTAGEPIRIKVKSDSSVLYGKTEEIIEEKYCNVSITVTNGEYPTLYREINEVINGFILGDLIGKVYNGTTKTFSLKVIVILGLSKPKKIKPINKRATFIIIF